MNLSERFIQIQNQTKLIQKSDRILVALSGGKDSVCLLFLLLQFQKILPFHLGACHVHHMIRQDEADRDLLFCRHLCDEWCIPFFSETVDIPAFCKKNKLGLEEGARLERYRLLEKVAQREGYHKIATAHSATDQAETLLFRLVRGCGLTGAKGILEQRGRIIRPMLSFTSDEIISFVENNQLPFTEDSSNSDILYSRNRLRHCVIPEMKKINPEAEHALSKFCKTATFQDALCAKLCNGLEKKNEVCFSDGKAPLALLQKLTLDEADFPILFTCLSRMTQSENISIDFDHFSRVVSLLKNDQKGKIIEISNGFSFSIQSDQLVFSKYESEKESINYQIEIHEGVNLIPPLKQKMTLDIKRQGKVSNFNKKLLIIHLSFDKIEGELFVRNFRSGDRIRMYGMSKSIKKLFCDAGIPRTLRPFIPIVCDEREIIWLPFFGLCDKVREEFADTVATLTLSGDHLEQIENSIERKKT